MSESNPRKGKRKTLAPCPKCGLHLERCICAHIPKLDTTTRVTLVIHAKELKRTTNTGQLAMHALVNSQMRIRGATRDPLDLADLLSPEYDTYLLYPASDAEDLETLCQRRRANSSKPKPVHLIVPDGNWRQAGKVHHRHQELAQLPRVQISRPGPAPSQHLRKEHFSEGMATLEAIAYALKALDEVNASAQLLHLYQRKLEATLKGRPQV